MATVEQLLARLGWGIESTPGVCGGDPRIAGARIPVWTPEPYRRLGMTEALLLASYPALRAADLVNAWAYVAAHPEEINEQIRENEEVARASGNGAASRELPIADFLEPLEYGWTEAGFEARQALKRYCEETHADY